MLVYERPPAQKRRLHLKTVNDVIEKVYGTGANLARRLDVSLVTISDWRKEGRFASNTFVVMNDDIAAANCTAPPYLWRMKG